MVFVSNQEDSRAVPTMISQTGESSAKQGDGGQSPPRGKPRIRPQTLSSVPSVTNSDISIPGSQTLTSVPLGHNSDISTPRSQTLSPVPFGHKLCHRQRAVDIISLVCSRSGLKQLIAAWVLPRPLIFFACRLSTLPDITVAACCKTLL